MKRIILALICVFYITFPVHADENIAERYIVKVSNDKIGMFSVKPNEGIYLGDGLYLTDDISYYKNIEYCFFDHEMELFDINYPESTSDEYFDEQWYLDNINAVAAREKGITGEDVVVAVIDTGINRHHQDFDKQKILQGYNCIAGSIDKYDDNDYCGHGTQVAGIICSQIDNETGISGIADGVSVLPIKITDGDTLYLSSLIMGIRKAIECNCDIINLSLGGSLKKADNTVDMDALRELGNAIKDAEEAGITVISAVGNSGGTYLEREINYPAGFESVIGVGSISKNNTVSKFSQRNNSVFISAPGEDIISLSNVNNAVIVDSGTSFSTPIVTGIVALIKEIDRSCGPEEIREILKNTAKDDEFNPGYDTEYGYGIIDIKAILSELSEYIPKIRITQGQKNSNHFIYIHNNTENGFLAQCYFAGYDACKVKNISAVNNKFINTLVTSVLFKNDSDTFFIWDNCMHPYTVKYSIKRR